MTTVRQGNLTSGIVEALGAAIVRGRYDEAPFPVEAELCREFGASRSVLREAVKMLTAKGLLGARPRQGTWVQPESRWNLLDPDVLRWLLERKFSWGLLREFGEMRLAFEPIAARLAAENGDSGAKASIQSAMDRMQAAAEGTDDPLLSDIAFHTAVLRAAGNRFYAELTELTETALRFSIRATNAYKGVPIASLEEHQAVADRITVGDGVGAEAAMRGLIEGTLELVRHALAQEACQPSVASASRNRA
jgi:DNA-binding FadR family transcriptional regulator